MAVQPAADGDVSFYTCTSTDLIWDQVAEPSTVVTQNAARLVDTPLVQADPSPLTRPVIGYSDSGTASAGASATAGRRAVST